jgi:hypothetical protein
MTNNISLLQYLQAGPPALTVGDPAESRDNTTNQKYSHEDINYVGNWINFYLNTIMTRYQPLLNATRIQPDPMSTTLPHAIRAEIALRDRFAYYLQVRVRRALRSGFQQLLANHALGNRTIVSFGEGEQAQTVDNYIPDTAYFAENDPQVTTRVNRAPGDLKPSFKWSLGLRNSLNDREQREFKQALSQVNWYMKQNNARFGFILTDRELVAIRRLDDDGRLELSQSIPWATQGNAAQPRLTVLLALWYLGMLASDETQWRLQ